MLIRTIFILCALLYGPTLQAETWPTLQVQTLTVAAGKTTRSSTTEHDSYRAEVNFDWKPQWWSNDSFSLSLNHALSIIHFSDKNTVNAISWAPNIILTSANKTGFYPYAQLGFGAAYFSDDKFESDVPVRYRFNGDPLYDDGTADMGSHGQFESSIALGLIKGRFGIRVKVYHYSNAGISAENGGIDVTEIGVSYNF
tara:strand:+ start:225 stop:818 length:594 start_codon:yes stop_codon:yes gene_type:complete